MHHRVLPNSGARSGAGPRYAADGLLKGSERFVRKVLCMSLTTCMMKLSTSLTFHFAFLGLNLSLCLAHSSSLSTCFSSTLTSSGLPAILYTRKAERQKIVVVTTPSDSKKRRRKKSDQEVVSLGIDNSGTVKGGVKV